MRLSRVALGLAGLAAAALLVGPGCRDATQVTLDISLVRAECRETHGTAITVGVSPKETEDHAALEYVTASTESCDVNTRQIGTLVITPTDPNRASVIVVVAYDQVRASSCKPPLYTGCIVARRQFSFSDHRNLHLPITIDPICKDVPCDAFSTCRTGKCFSSELAACDEGSCPEPGDPGDGGTSEDGQVQPDVGPLPVPDGSIDAGTDGSSSDASDASDAADVVDGSVPAAAARCDVNGNILHCADPAGGDVSCATSANFCCDTSPTVRFQCNPQLPAACTTARYCCATADCTGSDVCGPQLADPAQPRFCQPAANRCDVATGGTLLCPQTCLAGFSCCGLTIQSASCQARPCITEFCCMNADCSSGSCPPVVIVDLVPAGPAGPGLVLKPGAKGGPPAICN